MADNNSSLDIAEAASVAQEPVVYIVDDMEQILEIVSMILEAEGIKSKKFSSGKEFLAQKEVSQVGCLLLDNAMPGMTGLEVQAELLKRDNNIPIVFISGESRYNDVVDAVRDGALHFIQKPFTRSELLSHVRSAIEESRKRLQKLDFAAKNRALMNTLTSREREVCKLVTDGLTNKVIAEKLKISNGTVEFHRANMMKKLGAKSLADLMEISRGAA